MDTGAVDFDECTGLRYTGRCKCSPLCAVCNHRKHTAVHGPFYGQPAGSKPFDHAYTPKEEKATTSRM